MAARKENVRYSAQTDGCAYRPDLQQRLSAHFVDNRHGQDCKRQVRGANGDGLQVARDLAEPCTFEDEVQVVENRVDSGKLVEHGDGNCQENRCAVPFENRNPRVSYLNRKQRETSVSIPY